MEARGTYTNNLEANTQFIRVIEFIFFVVIK